MEPTTREFAQATVRRGRPPVANQKVSTTIRLSRDVIDHGRKFAVDPDYGALREWIENTTPRERAPRVHRRSQRPSEPFSWVRGSTLYPDALATYTNP